MLNPQCLLCLVSLVLWIVFALCCIILFILYNCSMSTAIGRYQVRYTMRLTNGLHPHWTKDQVLSHFLQKRLLTYFLLNWALNDDFRFNQYSRKLHDAESGPSSSSFSKRCLPHFQQFSCSLMILLFHFLSCSYF